MVLCVGTRLHQKFEWGTDADLKVIHIDLDPTRPGRICKPDIGIIADSKEALGALIKRLPRHLSKRASRKDELKAVEADVARELATFAPQKQWIDAIRAEVPEDGIVVEELTQVSYCSRVMYPVYGPRTYISSGYQGTLGWGLNVALGAQVAKPDRRVVSVSGDGGFMFGVQELATAVKHNIPVVSLVFTDNAYGNVRRMQKLGYEGRIIASDLTNPDFVKLGESFGIRSARATTPAELRTKMQEALKRDEPALIEIPVGEFPDPWKIFQRPKVRGV